MSRYDVIVIGAGHNGLTAAAYLAKAGMRVLVLERRGEPGGPFGQYEFLPGFTGFAGPHLIDGIDPDVMRELHLVRHGLRTVSSLAHVTLMPGGNRLVTWSDLRRTKREVARFSQRDAEALEGFQHDMARLRGAWRAMIGPHAVAAADPVAGAQLERFLLSSARTVLESYFESGCVKAHLAGPAFIGAAKGPFCPASAIHLLTRGTGAAQRGSTYVRGGPVNVVRALQSAFEAHGGELRCGAEVASIIVEHGVAKGVELGDGTRIDAGAVMSNLDYKRTFLTLFDWAQFDTDTLQEIGNYRQRGALARLNLALEAKPDFVGLRDLPAEVLGRVQLCYDLAQLEKAYDAWSEGFVPDHPVIELTIPSLHDPAMAPPGQHVMSVLVPFVPNHLFDGTWDDVRRARFAEKVVAEIETHAPGLGDRIAGYTLQTPGDFEREFGLTDGDIHHGDWMPDQSLFGPAAPGTLGGVAARNLYLCGAGSAPVTGLTSQAGRAAAHRVLTDRKRAA